MTDSAGRDFSTSCVYFSWHSVHHLLHAVQKCSNLKDGGHPYELTNLWPLNSPDLSPVDYII